MNDENMKVLTNIIGAVESGGQVYGRRDYSAYAAPYTNSNVEHTITLGWAQNYGDEAYRLILMIFTKNPDTFNRIDPTGTIKEMINGEHDWVKERWNPNTYQRYILLALIDSTTGHECQDELFEQLMKKYIADCEATYTKDVRAVMMYCEIRHLGGKSPVDRIFKRCAGDYSLDNIMAALKKDQSDTSSDNQVGDKKFWTRHQKCKEFIEKYAVSESSDSGTAEKEGGTETVAYSRSVIVKQAQSWIGCKESDGSHKKIIDIYNAHKPLARSYKVKYTDAWCATFVSAVAIKCGYTAIIPTECGCGNMITLFQKLGEWQENDAYVPSPGDVIFYDWDDSGVGDNKGGADHVGIVEKVSGSTITVIEGNKNNAVGRRTLRVNGRYIRGYGLPKYTDNGTSTATTSSSTSSSTNLSKGSTGAAVKTMQTMLIACGYSCGSYGADGSFGNDTYNALVAFQNDNGLTVDGVYGAISKAKLEVLYKKKTTDTDVAVSSVVTGVKKATAYAKKKDDNLAGAYTTTEDLNCRNDANVSSESLCIIPKGTKVKCYGYYSIASNGRKWLLIQFTLDGTKYTGFSSSIFLKKE